ncbi:unnamed protein product, partial [Symbiodinium microadriaticum]
MAVPGLRVPLPGGLNDEDDMDLLEQKRGVGSDQGRHDSPKKQKGAEEVVTLSALRTLLAETSHSLLQAQQVQITTALTSFEERQSSRLDKVEETIQTQGTAMGEVQAQLRELQDRVAKVELGGPSYSSGSDRKLTLVFGGWPSDTRRSVLLHQLDKALQGLRLREYLDMEPFTTGARRSVALCQFKRRGHETDGDTRQRMIQIIQVVNTSKVQLEGSQKPMWATFSKTPEERGRASLAAVVRKAVMRHAPHRVGDLDLEYPTGRTWIRDDQLTGLGNPPDEVHQPRLITTKGGTGWLDQKTLAKWLEVDVQTLRDLVVLGWNVGGAELPELPKAIRDSTGWRGAKEDLVVLQELPREGEGWQHQELEGKPVVSHRSSRQWRGTGIWYDPSAWCILRRVATEKGTWFKMRHLEASIEQWVGTSHFTPGCPLQQYEAEVQNHFDKLPRQAERVVYQGDVNTGFSWSRDGDQIIAVPKEGKGSFLHQTLIERGLEMGKPASNQLCTPTSRPRQDNRQGQCIDVLGYRGFRLREWRVHEDSYMKLGTDHELCWAEVVCEIKNRYPRHETGPRQWVGGISQIDHVDQAVVEELAVKCTKPVPGKGYRDSQEVKQAFKNAKVSGSAQAWKQALKLRKEARKQWERERLVRASQGDWGHFRALKPRRQEGWDTGFAEAQQGDPHQAVHDHLAERISQGCKSGGEEREWGVPLTVFKLDLEKAFDKLDRNMLLQRLEVKAVDSLEVIGLTLKELNDGARCGCKGTGPLLAIGLEDDPSVTEKLLANQCVQDDPRQSISLKEYFDNHTFTRPPEVTDNMQGIGDTITETAQHLNTGPTTCGPPRHDDSELPHAARREHDLRGPSNYPLRNFQQKQFGWQLRHAGDPLASPQTESEEAWFMQRATEREGWFSVAKRGFQNLLAEGEGNQAALQLRDRLRMCSDSGLHRAINEHLPDILADEGQVDDRITFTSDEWVRYVLEELSRVPGISTDTKQCLLGPDPLPFGIFHARMVWPDGTWSTEEELARAGQEAMAPAEPEADSAEEEDDTALFQAGERQVNRSLDELMEQFWQWFSEDRAVHLALAMLRQRTIERGDEDYQRWARRTLRLLGAGLEPNEHASQERTPPDFYRWSRRVEWFMHSNYLQEHHTGDETSMMDRDRYRKTTGKQWVWRTAVSSERASGSGDNPVLSPAVSPTSTHRVGGFDLPDPQQPMTQQQAVTTWKYLLFDRWAFSPPEARGVIPTTWLPHDTLQDVSAHLATMNQHNLLVLTTGLITMIRYPMAELSQSLDMAQVVLNTQSGEPTVDIDAEDEEDEVDLMQSFWETGGR